MDIRTWRRVVSCAAIVFCVSAAPAQENCTDEVALGFSASWVKSAVPFEGILGGETAAGELRVPVPEGERGQVEVFTNIVSRIEEGGGVQGWSFGIELEGAASILSATAERTDEICLPILCRQPFEILLDGKGIVMAQVLHLQKGTTLPPVGTRSVLAIQLGADADQGADDLPASLQFREGLVGFGVPVPNVITIGGDTTRACNFDTAALQITFTKATPPLFLRGNANGDSRVDIADPIWVLNELFRSGPRTTCRDAADANDDGGVDISDPILLLNRQFLGTEPPRPPFPQCGTDPEGDADGVTCLEGQASCDG